MAVDRPTVCHRTPLPALLLSVLALSGPASAGDDALLLPKGEIPEDRLVDVAIDLFSPGVSDAPASPLLLKGIRSAVRKSEARYLPIQLRNTLQSTGQWGTVRVVPGGADWAEILVSGAIEKSNGKDLQVRIVARDAAGRVWVETTYKQRADTSAYAKDRPVDGRDPFQVLYNRVANDLVRARDKRKPEELAAVREVARLRFAASMAPDPYAGYLATGRKGRARVERLPAADDPMIARIAAIRDRDHMFVDTLNEYYADFYARLDKPYDDWRAYSYTEQVALDSINRAATLKKILGGIAMFLAATQRHHVSVDVLVVRFSRRVRLMLGSAACLLGFVTWALLAYRAFLDGLSNLENGSRTATLFVIQGPFEIVLAIGIFLLCLTLLVQAFRPEGSEEKEAGGPRL